MKLYGGPPLIRNATHPADLFTEEEQEHIKKALSASYQRERYNRVVKVDESDRRIRGNLLRIARFHGYYAKGVDSNKKIIWGCLIQYKFKMPMVVISIIACDECGSHFHSYHYEDKNPGTLCGACQRKVKAPKKVPFELKTIPGSDMVWVYEDGIRKKVKRTSRWDRGNLF
jgi:hypothetical protein